MTDYSHYLGVSIDRPSTRYWSLHPTWRTAAAMNCIGLPRTPLEAVVVRRARVRDQSSRVKILINCPCGKCAGCLSAARRRNCALITDVITGSVQATQRGAMFRNSEWDFGYCGGLDASLYSANSLFFSSLPILCPSVSLSLFLSLTLENRRRLLPTVITRRPKSVVVSTSVWNSRCVVRRIGTEYLD